MDQRKISQVLIYLSVGITLFGLLMVGNASPVTAYRDFGDKWHYLKLQATWATVGLAGFFFMSGFPHIRLEKFANIAFISTIILLVLVLLPGLGYSALGARRWLNIGLFSFQPAELAKLTTSIYLARLFKSRPRFLHLAFVAGILAFLIMLEPDMGTTIVILGLCLCAYLGGGGKVKYILLSTPLAALVIFCLIFFSPYRLARLNTFLNYSHDPLGASYQIRQALIGIGSGGIFGVGLGQSRQKYDFLPEVATDSIFAVIGEEMGLIGTSALVIAFLGLTVSGFQISKHSTSHFSAILALGITSWLGLQAFINMSANIALLPFTGIPLPFVSYGGTALLVNLMGAGILVNISRSSRV